MKTEIWVGKVDLTGIYNHYKTLQFINFGNNGTANRLVYAGREECKQMIRENPKCGRMQADDSGKPRMCDCLSFDGEIEVAKWFLREME